MVGEKLGHYEIVEELGAGGMGIVYKARDLRLEREVAIKVIRPEWVSPTLQAAFLREARLASSLNHPGIVTIHDIVSHGEAECIVMEYVSGAPLGVAIPAGGMKPAWALGLAIQIGDALGAAHAAGVVHRDLKPANILVRTDGQIKILDFGLAKLVSGSQRDEAQTAADGFSLFAGQVVGTLAYMAPEQARGEALDQRADVFSLGAILYQMLSGQRPFQGENAAALLLAVQSAAPAPLRSADLPPGLEAVLGRALRKDPKERYASAGEMTRDLRAVESGTPTAAAPAAAEISVAAPAPAPPAAGSEKTSIAVLAFRELSPHADGDHWAAGLAAEVITALTGVPGLRIASQLASLHPRLAETDPADAALALGTRYAVTGSLRRAGERIRVSAELVDARQRRVVWSRGYDRQMTDIFAVQEDISRAIVGALGGELIRAASDFAFRTPAQNLDAWGLARKAYHLWNYEFSLAGATQALDLLRRAIALDPEYATARAYLGLYLITTVINRISPDLKADRAEAVEAAELACRLAPEEAEALESAALVWMHTGQYEKAVHALKRAVRLAPFDLVAWGYLGFAYACAGGPRELAEARDILTRLVAEAPDHPSLAFWHQFAAIAHLRLGGEADWLAAAAHGARAVEMQPGFVFNQVFCAEALCRLGREAEARAVMAGVSGYNPHFTQAVFEDVALTACRSAETVERLCGEVRRRGLFPA